ncbi:hypothetical protein [Acuticoccus kandeliae]|uniref:hypothetical protein n=1 Tax=Acuticoccus kandeliae TaxID=2073160 RepID=UPI000D3E3240|nr:hypothetical protein [Acuticoccus kandeliae]
MAKTTTARAQRQDTDTNVENAEPTVTLPSIKLGLAQGIWVGIQEAPEELKGTGKVPDRIALRLNTDCQPIARKKAEELLGPYRRQYLQVAEGTLRSFKGPDEFNQAPTPLQEVWRAAFRSSQMLSVPELIHNYRISQEDALNMIRVYNMLLAVDRDPLSTRPSFDRSKWTEAERWYLNFQEQIAAQGRLNGMRVRGVTPPEPDASTSEGGAQ